MKIAELKQLVTANTDYPYVDAWVTTDGLLVVEGHDGKGGTAALLKYGIAARKVYIGNLARLGLQDRQNEMQQLLR